jgi:hypothetical protein
VKSSATNEVHLLRSLRRVVGSNGGPERRLTCNFGHNPGNPTRQLYVGFNVHPPRNSMILASLTGPPYLELAVSLKTSVTRRLTVGIGASVRFELIFPRLLAYPRAGLGFSRSLEMHRFSVNEGGFPCGDVDSLMLKPRRQVCLRLSKDPQRWRSTPCEGYLLRDCSTWPCC